MSSTNKVSEATEFIKSVPEFIEAALQLIQTPWGWLILVFLVIWFLHNGKLGVLLVLLAEKENKRIKKLESYLSITEYSDKTLNEVVKDQLNAYFFKTATGLYVEGNKRNAFIELHSKTSSDIGWRQIRRAQNFIKVNAEGVLTVRDLTRAETLGYYFNLISGVIFVIMAISFFLVLSVTNLNDVSSVLLGVSSTIFLMFMAFYSLAENFPRNAAKLIKSEIDVLESEVGYAEA